MGSHQISICYIFIFSGIIAKFSSEKLPWGSPCKIDSECQDKTDDGLFYNPLTIDSYSRCKDSRCRCESSSRQALEFKDNNYVCTDMLYGYGDRHSCKENDPDSCLNGVCKEKILYQICACNDGFVYLDGNCRETVTVEYSENCTSPETGPVQVCDYDNLMRCNSEKCGCYKDYFYDVENKTCISKETYVEKYPEETIAGLDEFCGLLNGLPKLCNETANMTCVSKKCKCTKEFYPSYNIEIGENNTISMCESKANYVKENNLEYGYKVMPGVYCYDESDCITGLTCANNNECACPYPCKFDNVTITCDCGAVSAMEGASRAVLVGVIGGIAIIAFWGYMIKKTVKKKPVITQWNRDTGSIYTNHKTSPVIPNPVYAHCEPSAPISNTSHPISPVPNCEPSPVPPYPISQPNDLSSAPVGFSAPAAPPPDATQQPPPYNSNPNPYPASPAPYTSSSVPYPSDPATAASNSLSSTVSAELGYGNSPDTSKPIENSTNPSANAPPPVDIYKPVIS